MCGRSVEEGTYKKECDLRVVYSGLCWRPDDMAGIWVSKRLVGAREKSRTHAHQDLRSRLRSVSTTRDAPREG